MVPDLGSSRGESMASKIGFTLGTLTCRRYWLEECIKDWVVGRI